MLRGDGQSPGLEPGQGAAKADRQSRITEHLLNVGDSSPQNLAKLFNVSLMTIHRDLDALERRGVVRKFHGGVTVQPSGVFESQLPFRMKANTAAKKAIAAVALRFVHPGMSIMLDDSTSGLQMVQGLDQVGPLHIVTNFVRAIVGLAEHSVEAGLTIVGIGGMYDHSHDAFIGLHCLDQLTRMRADALFMSTSAVCGVDAFHQEERIVAVKRAMMDASMKRYLLLDSSKFRRVALHNIATLTEFDCVITDQGADEQTLQQWRSAGVEYEIAPPV